MGMDSWLVGHAAFWFTVREVNPTRIVDHIVTFWVDMMTPGRGAGESQWWMRAVRNMEQSSERTRREIDIRSELRQWDNEHPELHHELIIRYLCGVVVSVVTTSFYHSLLRAIFGNNNNSHGSSSSWSSGGGRRRRQG